MTPTDLDLTTPHTIKAIRELRTHSSVDVQRIDPPSGFHSIATRVFPNLQDNDGSETLVAHWTTERSYEILERSSNDAPVRIGSFETSVIASREINAQLKAELLCSANLDGDHVLVVRDAFLNFDPNGPQTIFQYVRGVLDANRGLTEEDFVLAYFYSVTAIADAEDSDLHLLRTAQINDGTHRVEQRPPTRHLDGVLNPSPDPCVVEVPQGADHSPAVDAEAARRAPTNGCEGFSTFKKEIKRIPGVPEFKTEWRRQRWKVGRCWTWGIGSVTRRRNTELVAYVTATYPRNIDRNIERVLVKCAEEAAIIAAVFLIIFVNLTQANALFVTHFVECIRRHIDDVLDCTNANIIVVKEVIDDWH